MIYEKRWFFSVTKRGFSCLKRMVNFGTKLGKNRPILNFSLCAKFNRFFIILGGGGRPAEKRGFLGNFGVPEVPYTGKTAFLTKKMTKNPDTPSSFFGVFFGLLRSVYTGKMTKTEVFGVKLPNFEEKSWIFTAFR